MNNNVIAKPELFDQELLMEIVTIPGSFSFESDIILSKNFSYTAVTENARDRYFEKPSFCGLATLKLITTKVILTNKELAQAVKDQNVKETMAVLHCLLANNSYSLDHLKNGAELVIAIPELSRIPDEYGDFFCLDLIGNSHGWSLEDSWIHRRRRAGTVAAVLFKNYNL